MKNRHIILMLIMFVVLSASQIYLWKDQQQQWQIMSTQIKMLNRLLQLNDEAPFIYEDELPGNYSPNQSLDI